MSDFETKNHEFVSEVQRLTFENDKLDDSCHTLHKEFEAISAEKEELDKR